MSKLHVNQTQTDLGGGNFSPRAWCVSLGKRTVLYGFATEAAATNALAFLSALDVKWSASYAAVSADLNRLGFRSRDDLMTAACESAKPKRKKKATA